MSDTREDPSLDAHEDALVHPEVGTSDSGYQPASSSEWDDKVTNPEVVPSAAQVEENPPKDFDQVGSADATESQVY